MTKESVSPNDEAASPTARRFSGFVIRTSFVIWPSSFRIQYLPYPQRFGRAPGLRVAAALRVRRVAIDDLRQVAEATVIQQLIHAAQISFGSRDRRWGKIPRARQRFAKDRERPRPGGAVVISRFSPCIFIAF